MYKIENLSNRQFEILAANYAKHIAPQCEWVLTKQIADFNRDFESEYDDSCKWGEAKRTDDSSTAVSKSRWDPTLLSAILKNNVDEIYLITCGNIPLNYVVRAEHLKNTKIKKIYYINRLILDNWLSSFNGTPVLDMFDTKEEFNLYTIATDDQSAYQIDQIISNFYNLSNLLEPVKFLYDHVFYELNITVFSSRDSAEIELMIPTSFECREIDIVSLTPNSKIDGYKKTYEAFEFDEQTVIVGQGYSQIRIIGFLKSTENAVKYGAYFKNNKPKVKEITVKSKKSNNKKDEKVRELSLFENYFHNRLHSKTNTIYNDVTNIIMKVYAITSEDLSRHFVYDENFGGFYSYKFCGDFNSNAKTLCLLATKLLLNINLQNVSQNNILETLNGSIEFCDFDVSDLAIGCVNPIFASSAILNYNNEVGKNRNNSHMFRTQTDNCSIFFIEGIENLTDEQYAFLYGLQNGFRASRNASILLEKESRKADLSSKESVVDDLDYLSCKAEECYKSTDFYSALYYINQIRKNSIALTLNQMFKYADCLNHCGSLNASKEAFEVVIKSGNKYNSDDLKLMNEAQTEIFNIRFWQLDVKNLVKDIDNFLEQNEKNLKAYKNSDRGLYSYYNLLNRKMVTLYLQGLYDDADRLYNFILENTDVNYENYLAFAHMDSARGLYKKDINEAYVRMKLAKAILNKLYKKNKSCKEKRRYLDCIVELEYIKFIIGYNKHKTVTVKNLENAVFKIKINGYRNMLLKCYLKLATCYLAVKDLDKSDKCLAFVKRNGNFESNTRLKYLYRDIKSKLNLIKNVTLSNFENLSSDYFISAEISFNCEKTGLICLESRIW